MQGLPCFTLPQPSCPKPCTLPEHALLTNCDTTCLFDAANQDAALTDLGQDAGSYCIVTSWSEDVFVCWQKHNKQIRTCNRTSACSGSFSSSCAFCAWGRGLAGGEVDTGPLGLALPLQPMQGCDASWQGHLQQCSHSSHERQSLTRGTCKPVSALQNSSAGRRQSYF